MKFLVPNYSCLQNPWLGAYAPQIPVLSLLCPQLNLLNPPEKNSWVRNCCTLMILSPEFEMFQTKFVENLKTSILRPVFFFFFFKKIHAVYEMMWKKLWSWTGYRWQYNTAHALCMLHKWVYTHTHTLTHTLRICNTLLLLFRGNSGYANSPQCYVLYANCISSFYLGVDAEGRTRFF